MSIPAVITMIPIGSGDIPATGDLATGVAGEDGIILTLSITPIP